MLTWGGTDPGSSEGGLSPRDPEGLSWFSNQEIQTIQMDMVSGQIWAPYPVLQKEKLNKPT